MRARLQGYAEAPIDVKSWVIRLLVKRRVVTEKKVLNGFDFCSPQLLWDKFLKAGFEMHVGGTNKPATTKLPDRGKVNIVAFNM